MLPNLPLPHEEFGIYPPLPLLLHHQLSCSIALTPTIIPLFLRHFTFLPAILLPCTSTIRPPLVTHPPQPQHYCRLHRINF